MWDSEATGLTLRRHSLALLCGQLEQWELLTAAKLHNVPTAAGCVRSASRRCASSPETARGIVFV